MSSGKPEPKSKPLLLPLAGLSGLGYGWWHGYVPGSFPEDWQYGVGVAAMAASAGLGLQVTGEFLRRLEKIRLEIEAASPRDIHGSARYANRKDIKKAGLHKLGPGRQWVGVFEDLGLWLKNETHALILSPAAGGKTVRDVMVALATNNQPMLINDMKGELFWVTAEHRKKAFNHAIRVINPDPASGWMGDTYNVCDFVVEAVASMPVNALIDARGIALQLLPEPVRTDVNVHFRAGSRSIITFVVISLAILSPAECCLPTVQKIITDTPVLLQLCRDMKDHLALEGDVAAMAQSLLSCEERTPREFQAFLNGAVQALEPFAPSGALAGMVRSSSFKFRELKTGCCGQKVSIYVCFDMTRMAQFKKLTALLNWACMVELQRCAVRQQVLIVMDEASNFPIADLPNMLTALRGYGIAIMMVFQEIAEIRRVYGDHAAETILSQCHLIKAYGIKSKTTAELLSAMAGIRSVEVPSFGLGKSVQDGVATSRSLIQRPLITPDEVRRMDGDEALVFIGNLPVLRVRLPGYQEMEPFSDLLGTNPLHGHTKFKGHTKVSFSCRELSTLSG